MANEQDLVLIKKISEGDSKSFESLMIKYQKLVFGYSVKMLKNRQKAEDVTQEAWMRVIKNSQHFKQTGSVKAWILSIARNLIIDEFRQNKKWIDLDDEKWESIEDPQIDLETLFSDQQREKALNLAFEELPENQKIILSMVLLEELNQSEVAVKLGMSVGAVKASLFRSREQLKKAMGAA